MSEPAGTRTFPLVGPIILLIGFVAVVVASIFTVLIPEVTSDEAIHENVPPSAVDDPETADED